MIRARHPVSAAMCCVAATQAGIKHHFAALREAHKELVLVKVVQPTTDRRLQRSQMKLHAQMFPAHDTNQTGDALEMIAAKLTPEVFALDDFSPSAARTGGRNKRRNARTAELQHDTREQVVVLKRESCVVMKRGSRHGGGRTLATCDILTGGSTVSTHHYSKGWSVRNRCQAIARLDFLEIDPKFLRAAARRSGNERFQRRFLICPKKSAPRAPADFLKAISKATSLTVRSQERGGGSVFLAV